MRDFVFIAAILGGCLFCMVAYDFTAKVVRMNHDHYSPHEVNCMPRTWPARFHNWFFDDRIREHWKLTNERADRRRANGQ